eukprot:CAMPEP_0118984180 /NCGR_PEP_ID=MMETSP1173-20130426/37299_1 /TAXON_ID=1034831 /ORGANISM="Rhizochromulina marina cf, Strain CCMP1243" /LENGTH=61 /DNA_ID=CAMNT_0006934829 /DNA_START=1 /DNA_END=183 /DNA_ORIENTATION=-
MQLAEVIKSIRRKDPKIYDKSTSWFSQKEEGDEDEEEVEEVLRSGDGTEQGSRSRKKQRFK